MSDDDRLPRPGVALALSGGGFRATLYHIGSLWRLNELGWLPKIVRLTSVSGGSITAGYLGYRWADLSFENDVATNYAEVVAAPLRRFCARTIDVPGILKGNISGPFATAGDYLAGAYQKHLFAGKRPTLAALPEKDAGPEIILYGSNYQSGVSLRMSRAYVSDYRVGSWPDPDLTLAKAIAVSSAFPPLFSPIILKTDPAKWRRTEYADLFDEPRYRARLVLADGGVYDNMGIEAIWKRYQTVLVSDAGAPLAPEPGLALTRWSATNEVLRVLGIAVEQQRALRKRWLIDDFKTGRQKGAYWGITTRIDNYRLADAMARDTALTDGLKSVRTRLNAFSGDEQGRLINWGYALADTAMRQHVLSSPAPAPSWPIPEFPL